MVFRFRFFLGIQKVYPPMAPPHVTCGDRLKNKIKAYLVADRPSSFVQRYTGKIIWFAIQ